LKIPALNDIETKDHKKNFRPTAPGLFDWLRSASIQDLFSNKSHSKDFNGSRAEYITLRVRVLALAFAILAPLWIPVDHIFLSEEKFFPLRIFRLGFSLLFLALCFWTSNAHNLFYARLRLIFFLTIPSLFYIASRQVLGGNMPEEGVLAGYSFLPFLLVVFLAIFPLTLIEGISYATGVILIFLCSEILYGSLFTIKTLGDIWLLVLLSGIAMWAQLAQLHMLLSLYREATRDTLTGLVNRRVLTKWLDMGIQEARTNNTPLSVLLFDLDLFKKINDNYGHLTGDRVLQAFSKLLSQQIFNKNFIGRYGGEEFLAILPGKDEDWATQVAERIRKNCRNLKLQAIDGDIIQLTVSVGVTELNATDDSQSLLNRVDKGLYLAKESGRDLVARSL